MIWVVSRYHHDIDWLKEYTNEYVLYDRTDGATPNIGSDIYDKLTWIVDNYHNLPDVVCLIKANLFKYITKDEFNEVVNNKIFTPLLTQNHAVREGIAYYKDGMYYEKNNSDYVKMHPTKNFNLYPDFAKEMGLPNPDYLPFAPGSNYIVPEENILQHPIEFYIKLRSYLDWDVYPGEAMFIERSLYNIWK